MSELIRPNHYKADGRKECIEEMIDVFGYNKVEAFCELNSYKYRYRHAMKNGKEDLLKAATYDIMLETIRKRRFETEGAASDGETVPRTIEPNENGD